MEIGPTTAINTIARTAAARPTAPLNTCSPTEPLASGELWVVAGASVMSQLVRIPPTTPVRSCADHPCRRRAATYVGAVRSTRAGRQPRIRGRLALPFALEHDSGVSPIVIACSTRPMLRTGQSVPRRTV